MSTHTTNNDAHNNWVAQFCSAPSHHFFCLVPALFAQSRHNLLHLPKVFKNFDKLLPLIFSSSPPENPQNHAKVL